MHNHHYNVKQMFSFIYTFDGEIYCKLKNIHLGNPTLISKISFFYSFTLVYMCPHSFAFVYTLLHSSSDSSVFLEQIVGKLENLYMTSNYYLF